MADAILSRLLTIEEAADILHVSVSGLRNFIRQGDIRATRVGNRIRFTTTALEDYIDSHSTQPAEASPA